MPRSAWATIRASTRVSARHPRTALGRSACTGCTVRRAARAARDARARPVRRRRGVPRHGPGAAAGADTPRASGKRAAGPSGGGHARRHPGQRASGAEVRRHRRREHLLPGSAGRGGAVLAAWAYGRAHEAPRTDTAAVRDYGWPARRRRDHRRGPAHPGRRTLPPRRPRGRRAARRHHGLHGHAGGAVGTARASPAAFGAAEAAVRRCVVALLGALLTAPAATAAQQPQTIRINYVNADLGDVVRSLGAVLNVNVVLTDVPSRRITFQTPEPVAAPQVGAVLEAILESQGLVLVQRGPVAQVMPEEKRPSTGPVRVGKDFPSPPPLGLVTQIVPLEFIRGEEGVSLLKQVASKTARVEVVPRSNSVLITDRGVHIARYLDLLRQLDVKTGGEAGLRTYVYPLKHASATELATTLGQVFGAAVAAPPARARFQALEERSLSGALRSLRERGAQSLQQRMQTPVAPPSGLAAAPVAGVPE